MRRAFVPWLILGLALVLTVLSAVYVAVTTRSEARERFEHACHATQDDLSDRLATYVSLLRGGAGLFAARGTVDFDEFAHYVRQLGLRENYPGIQGIGYAARAPAVELEELTERMQAQIGPEFHVWPSGQRDEYYPIIYLQPLDRRNHAAIGYDMFSDAVRREAMQLACDTGTAAASGRVTLVQEIDRFKQAGFLIYFPLYRSGTRPATIEQRRTELVGFVYSPYRVKDLLDGIFGTQRHPRVHFQIYDRAPGPASVLYDSAASEPYSSASPGYVASRSIEVAGRPWTLAFSSRPEFDASVGSDFGILVFLTGFVISLLLFGITWSQARARDSAEGAAAELRRSQEALRLSEAQAREIVQSSVIGIMVADLSGRVHQANEAFLSTLGYTEDDLAAGRINFMQLTPSEWHPLTQSAMERLRQTGKHPPFEKEYCHRDGRRIPVMVSSAYLGGPQELSVRFVLDLTELKRGQRAQLRYARHMALRGDVSLALTRRNESADRFLQSCCEAIVRHLDAAFARIWLINAEEGVLLLKASAGIYTHLDGPHARIHIGHLKIGSIAEQGEPVLTNEVQNDNRISHPEWAREQGMVGFAGYPLLVEGRVVGVVALFARHALDNGAIEALATVADVAAQGVERRRAEDALARYREHLEQLVRERTDQLEASQERLRRSERLASLGTLSTGIAHEINNPVNAILMSAQYALNEEGPEWIAEARKALGDIEQEAKRCGRIVRNVLQFARARRSQQSLHDLNAIVSKSARLARNYVADGDLHVELELSEALPQLMLDPTQIEQVIVNLMQNAADAAGGPVNVKLSTQAHNGEVLLVVADDGPGIPPQHLSQVFDPFFSTRREKGGTGLGLSMVHGIITEHSGWIDVESAVGSGAVFRIHLPLTSGETTNG